MPGDDFGNSKGTGKKCCRLNGIGRIRVQGRKKIRND